MERPWSAVAPEAKVSDPDARQGSLERTPSPLASSGLSEPTHGTKQSRSRRPGGGRKPLLDDADRAFLRERVTEHPSASLPELVSLLQDRTGKKASASTIRTALRQMGFNRVKPVKAPSMPAPQTAPRYQAVHRREPTAAGYPSSLTEAEWGVIAPLLEAARDPRGRKAIHDKRLMMNAVFYLVRTGCQWRMLPKDFPPWQAVWSQFRRLRDSGTLERLYDALHALWRKAAERNEQPTAGIIDSQTVKTTEKGGPAATTLARRPKAASATRSSM
jgi:transposase